MLAVAVVVLAVIALAEAAAERRGVLLVPGFVLLLLVSEDRLKSKFNPTIYEGKKGSRVIVIETARKITLQTVYAPVPLVRIDINPFGKHMNPDGVLIEGSHVHIYNEEYGTRFAMPLSEQDEIPCTLGNENDPMLVFEEFRKYCNIDDALRIDWRLDI